MPDVEHCPACGEAITSQERHMFEDLLLNVYRTEFRCPACQFVGEVIRHELGNPGVETHT